MLLIALFDLGAGCGLSVQGASVDDPAPGELSDAMPNGRGDTGVDDGAMTGHDDAGEDGSRGDAGQGGDASGGGDGGAPFCDVNDPTLVVCFRFDDAVKDDSVHAQPAQTSGPISFVPGVHGSAVVMSATTTIHLQNTPAWTYDRITVETWLYPDQLPASNGRSGLLDKSGSFGVFLYGDGTVSCIFGSTASAVVVQAGKWTHVACVVDGTDTILYANGVAKTRSAAGTVSASTSNIAVGGNDPSGDPLVGKLDDLRVLTRALSPAEIAAHAVP